MARRRRRASPPQKNNVGGDGVAARQYAQQREAVERESAADKAAAAVAAAMSRGLYRPGLNADVSKGADDDGTAAAAADAILEEDELDDDVEGDECFGCIREASAASKNAARQVVRRLDLLVGLACLAVAVWLRVSRGRAQSRWRWVLFTACIFLGAWRRVFFSRNIRIMIDIVVCVC